MVFKLTRKAKKKNIHNISKRRTLIEAQKHIKLLNLVYKRKQKNITILDILNKDKIENKNN